MFDIRPQANTMTMAGEDNKPREIPFLGKSFAIDIENGVPGWLLIGDGQRDWKPFPINSETPPSPGPELQARLLGFGLRAEAFGQR